MRRFLTLGLLLAASPLSAQGKFPPDSFTNLKVLPKDISKPALIGLMRSFTGALGVRCQYCHVGREGMPLDSFNFASDDKRTKRAARVMIDMVSHINDEHLAEVPDRPMPHVVVKCATCHRGLTRPLFLEDDLASTLADSGIAVATKRYRALRERYYGSGSYDFGENSLNSLARAEGRAGHFDNAVALLTLNAEFNPNSWMIPATMGDIYLQHGDTAKALGSLRAAVAKDSTLAFIKDRINQLTAAMAKKP
jgi:hypothetical protein